MRRIKKSLVILFILSLPMNLTSAGMPVFDIENWIYSIYQYYQMVEEVKTMVQQVQQSAEQFQETYQMLASGDIKGIMNSRYSTNKSLLRVTNTLDNALDSYTEAQMAMAGLIDADMHWAIPEYFESVSDDLSNVYERNARNIEDFHEAQKEIRAAREEDQDLQNTTIENATSSTSPTQQIAAAIAVIDAGNRQAQEDAISADTDVALTKNQEEILDAMALAKQLELIYKQDALKSEATRNLADAVSRQSAKITIKF